MTLAELAKSRRTPSAVRKALRWVDDYLKECPALLTRQGWHDSAPTLITRAEKASTSSRLHPAPTRPAPCSAAAGRQP